MIILGIDPGRLVPGRLRQKPPRLTPLLTQPCLALTRWIQVSAPAEKRSMRCLSPGR